MLILEPVNDKKVKITMNMMKPKMTRQIKKSRRLSKKHIKMSISQSHLPIRSSWLQSSHSQSQVSVASQSSHSQVSVASQYIGLCIYFVLSTIMRSRTRKARTMTTMTSRTPNIWLLSSYSLFSVSSQSIGLCVLLYVLIR